ncbi:MAG TPA: extracellular solute-binding protein, partial [Streptosporangiaceae bacterium]
MNPGSHPCDPRGLGSAGIGRRTFLAAAGVGLAAGGLGSALGACGSGAAAAPKHPPLPTPRRPVMWPIDPANKPIADGQLPETDATLEVYTWPGHVSQRCLSDFSKTYRCTVRRTNFTTIVEALRTLIHGRDRFDVFMGVPTDVIGLLVSRSLIRPLNHSYIPNISQAWPVFTDPYYDSHWLYTVPYTVFTTGIAWRKDMVDLDPYALANGWTFPWVAKSRGRTAILADYRESIGLGLLKNGVRDLNTTDPLLIDDARQALLD